MFDSRIRRGAVPVSNESAEHVIVVHGIWMRGIAMLPLARRLRSAGFSVETFDYRSVTGEWNGSLERLRERWRQQSAGRVHVVGHSLGGMLALDLATQDADLPAGQQSLLAVHYLDQPQLLKTPSVDGGGRCGRPAITDGSQEVGVVRDADDLALVAVPGRSGDTGRGLHQGAPHAAVHYSVRLVVLGLHIDGQHDPICGDLFELDAQSIVESAGRDLHQNLRFEQRAYDGRSGRTPRVWGAARPGNDNP